MEDEAGQMRPSLETAFLELLNTDRQGIGDLVVTTLTNPFMPLIRYRIGDLVQRVENPYGTRYVLHGRAADAFDISAGQRITTRQVDQCFAELVGIAHYQLIQRGGKDWLLRFVPDGLGPEPGQLAELQERISGVLQTTVPLRIQKTDMLVPESSGKFRLGYPLKKA
jgi:phenylacetate-CoA ligase